MRGKRDLCIVGLNANGWPVKRRRAKILHANNLIAQPSPDILVVLETAQTLDDVLMTSHDGYINLTNPVNSTDPQLALGHEIDVIYRDSIQICRLLTQETQNPMRYIP